MSLYERCVVFLENPILSPEQNDKYEKERELLSSVKSGNVQSTRELIRQGVDVNAKERNGKTCLYYATAKDYEALVHELLAAGANPSSNEKYSPLLNAIEAGNTEVAELLIKAQLDTDVPINFKAIFMAVDMKQKDTVKALLDSGSEIISPHGESVLYHAVENRLQNLSGNSTVYLDILRLLLNHDASLIHKYSKEQFNPAKALLANGTVADICLFTDYGFKIDDCGLKLPLHCAANNQDNVLEFLLKNIRCDIEEKDSDGCTVLAKAVTYNNLGNVQILIHNGANVNTTNWNGETPLLIAVANNFVECADVLLDFGARVNLDPDNRKTPFEMAISHNCPECLELLIASGAHFKIGGWLFSKLADSISPDILQILLRNMALFEFLGREVDPKYYKVLVEDKSAQRYNSSLRYFNNCKIELALLQTSILHDTTTFYKVLTNEIPKNLFINELVLGIVNSECLSNMFPRYGRQIYETFVRAKAKAELMDGAIRGINIIFPFDVRSSHIGENVLKYLTKRDLQNLGELDNVCNTPGIKAVIARKVYNLILIVQTLISKFSSFYLHWYTNGHS